MPDSILTGMMWANARSPADVPIHLRHTCEQDEGMAGYGWTTYDARRGGTHVVNDTRNKLNLITHFVKDPDNGNPNTWGLRVNARRRTDAQDRQKSTVVFYIGVEGLDTTLECTKEHQTAASKNNVVCKGRTAGLGHFELRVLDELPGNEPRWTSVNSMIRPVEKLWQAKEILVDLLKDPSSPIDLIPDNPGKGNLHFIQKTFEGDCDFDIIFSPKDAPGMIPQTITDMLHNSQSMFVERFESAFLPKGPFQDEQHTAFSAYLLSNVLGGIGYFHGTSKVGASTTPEFRETVSGKSDALVEEKGPYHLFSAVPSRPFFPRGFLWDEGFHLQVIMDWDMDLALDIVNSWFVLMDEDGWIAREQILGPEARSKVPSEFQTQYTDYANPPTLFLIVQAFVAKSSGDSSYFGIPSRFLSDRAAGKSFLNALYPKLRKHYEWFRRTQAGGNLTLYGYPDPDHNQGYRWRGRTPRHILTSGLDDYPRAQEPHPGELHVDALSWVGTMATALREISAFLGKKGNEAMFKSHENDVIRSLDSIHWSETHQAYCDTTIGTSSQVEKVCHKGYVSLFPFTNKLMGLDHPHLEAVLDLIRNPEELRSPYGLRSLSLKDEYYGTDENYWRSPIWININYMVIARLLVSLTTH
ncbi:MAG: hypothetical protein Q9218_003419 [Villophora microphyllina]